MHAKKLGFVLFGFVSWLGCNGAAPEGQSTREGLNAAPERVAQAARGRAPTLPQTVEPSLRAAFQRAVQQDATPAYRVEISAGRASIQNAQQRFSARFEADGVTVTTAPIAREPSTLKLALAQVGRETTRTDARLLTMEPQDRRVRYLRRSGVTEWWENGPLGLEHGFDVAQKPEGDGLLVVQLDVGGSLVPAQRDADVAFVGEGGRAELAYRDAFAIDARGQALPIRLVADARARRVSLIVDDANATYPIAIDPLVASEQTVLKANDTATSDELGTSVDIGGDLAVIGVPLDSDNLSQAGSAYVFSRTGSTWTFEQKITASDAAATDRFGTSVSISFTTIVVGAPGADAPAANSGAAYVYLRSGTTWALQQKLTGSDSAASDEFGSAVAISGNTIVVGAPQHDGIASNAGAAYTFARAGTVWTQQGKLTSASQLADDRMGQAVALETNTAVLGSPADDVGAAVDAGSVYVFLRTGTTWAQQAKITASDAAASDAFGTSVAVAGSYAAAGAPGKASSRGLVYAFFRNVSTWGDEKQILPPGSASGDRVGAAVDLGGTGDLLAIGAPGDDGPATDAGTVFAYGRTGDGAAASWALTGTLTQQSAGAGDAFGSAVSFAGATIVAGAPKDDNFGSNSGTVEVHVNAAGWSRQTVLGSPDAYTGNQDAFGQSVDLDGDTAVIGAPNDNAGGASSGAAYVYTRSGVAWSLQQKLTAMDASSADYFGTSVTIVGNTIAVGARGADGATTNTGAVYVFTRTGSVWSQVARITATDSASLDQYGLSVSLSGPYLAVGAPRHSAPGVAQAGAVYVYNGSGASWTLEQKLRSSPALAMAGGNAAFGTSVDVDSTAARLVGGAPGDDSTGTDRGRAYAFARAGGGTWSEYAILQASDAVNGDAFGSAVDVDGNLIVVGAPYRDDGGADTGSAYLFAGSGGTYIQLTKFAAMTPVAGDRFGSSIGLQADYIVVGAPHGGSGHIVSFVAQSAVVTQKLDTTGASSTTGDQVGWAVAVSANTVLAGAPGDDRNGPNAGVAFPFVMTRGIGDFCTTGDQCPGGLCVDRVCCMTACGGGATNDCQACSTAYGGTTNGTCTALTVASAAVTTCRAASGGCDVAETCTASSTTCPADAFVAAGTSCRAAAGPCDVAETCSGSAGACPADAKLAAGTVCRASGGVCDVAETCDGTSSVCSLDLAQPAGTTCRASAGVCDPAEMCDGTAKTCPSDVLNAASVVCRGAAGPCDDAETCTGVSAACPMDTLKAAGTVCRTSGGVCDVAESCSGASAACPVDGFVAAGTMCRASAGACDVAETCQGFAAACPADAVATRGTTCRASAGVCDSVEQCDGATTACPADGFAGAGTVCRVASGACDAAETCSGSAAACPADGFAAAGTVCRVAAGVCDTAETCTGGAATCPADALTAAGTTCRASTGVCDTAETCTGASTDCPANAFASSATVCRASTGGCDAAESCTGSSAGCPTDVNTCCASDTDCSDGNTCTADHCNMGTGVCHSDPPTAGCCMDAAGCDDGNACTVDSCTGAHTCSHMATAGCCAANSDCSDGDVCTTDACNFVSHTCLPSTPIVGCGDAGPIADLDAGSVLPGTDAGTVEPGTDAGSVAPGTDAGSVVPGTDAGSVAPGTDGGPALDGAVRTDSGSATGDASTRIDSGTSGAPDAGETPASEGGGCGCHVAGGASTDRRAPFALSGLLGLLALVVARRRRR